MKFLGKEINRFHLEITTNCVLECPACQRTGKTELPLLNWDLPMVQNIFPFAAKSHFEKKNYYLIWDIW